MHHTTNLSKINACTCCLLFP